MPQSPCLLRPSSNFTPRSISGLALWLDAADSSTTYTTDAGPVTAVSAPTDIAGCAGWWDASDASTLFSDTAQTTLATSTGSVAAWKSKTGSLVALQSTSGARPTRSGNRLQFTAATSFMSIANAGALFSSVGEVFVVFEPTSSSYELYSTRENSSYFRYSVNAAGYFGFLTTDRASAVAAGLVPSSGSHIASQRTDASSQVVRVDGLQIYSGAPTNGFAAGTTHYIGADGPSALAQNGLGGYIAEIISFNALLSSSDRARVEAYLAAKWGITGVHRATRDEIAPVSSPTELSGCALWLDGADSATMFDATSGGSQVADGSGVARWEDKSGNGRHATQGTLARRPARQSGQQNGRGILRFSGAQVLAAPLTDVSSQTAFIVAKASATGSQRVFSYLGVAGSRSLFSSTNWRWWSGNFDSGIASTSYGVASVVLAGSTAVSLFGNGTAGGSGTTSASVSGTLAIGAEDAGLANPFSGDVAEIVVYDSALSTTDRARVEKYLANKWGIANVPDPTPPVGYWGDKSGNARHATQATGANRPTIATSSLNSRSTVAFAGASSQRLGATVPGADSQLFTVLAVLRNPFYGAGVVVGERGGNFSTALHFQGASQSNRLTFYPAGRVEQNYASHGATAVIYGISKDTASLWRGYQNGARVFSDDGSVITGQHLGNLLRNIGASTGGASAFTGNIAELIAYPASISDSQRQRLERYLAAKWGITLAPQVSNADAQDWVNRVYANGGTVSASTAAAVSAFCDAIDYGVNGVSIRDRFYRLNLFCGTGLNACLVPLYRGQSLAGTQYGNTTDTNNAFATTDYSETGAGAGLWYGGVGTNASKRLDTGINGSALSPGDRHCSAYEIVAATTDYSPSVISGNALTSMHAIGPWTTAAGYRYRTHNTIGGAAAGTTSAGMWLGSDTSSTASVLYKNGAVAGSTSGQPAGGSGNTTYQVLGTSSGEYSEARLGAYSIGLSMTAAQASAYYTAMQAFQTALSRNV